MNKANSWLKELSNLRLSRYVFIGGSVYLLEILIIITGQKLGLKPLLTVSISYWTGILSSFLLQKFVTFRDKRTQMRIILNQSLAYILLVLFNFIFTLILVRFLSTRLPVALIRTVAIIITTAWNYYLYKTKIF